MQWTLSAATNLALILTTLPAPAMAEQAEVGPPDEYACANGIVISVTHLGVRAANQTHDAIEVEFPTGREVNARTRALLPKTQTSSGVRYASDITEFHIKSDTARFRTLGSAKSEAIQSVECTFQRALNPLEPITQGARAGRYFIDTGHTAAYFPAEAICIGKDASGFLGINRAAGKSRAVIYNGRGAKQFRVGQVDAGVGQRRYTLTSFTQPEEQVSLHFVAPGMREPDLPSATAGFSSISQGGDKVDCFDNDGIVYLGMRKGFGVAITLGDDGLAVRTFGEDKDPAWQDMREGYVSVDERETVFHFFDGQSHLRVEADHNGGSGVGKTGDMMPRIWSIDTPIAQRSEWPEAYFLADALVLKQHAPMLSAATSKLLKSLATCNHLAGETSEDQERNAVIARKWDAASCNTVSATYALAIQSAVKGTPLFEYLKGNAPNWM
ncbi:MAG: hypothetical protein AAF709_09295 [Pseudomonadota bacterium]